MVDVTTTGVLLWFFLVLVLMVVGTGVLVVDDADVIELGPVELEISVCVLLDELEVWVPVLELLEIPVVG